MCDVLDQTSHSETHLVFKHGPTSKTSSQTTCDYNLNIKQHFFKYIF